MATPLSMLDLLQCHFVIPDSNKAPAEIVSRWSDTNIDRPALVVTPETDQDVQASVRVAKANNLTITAAGGGHGTFVPVDSGTMYMDMGRFKMIELDEENGTVRLGGGVITGELVKFLADKGYYTPVANCNAVGVVGSVLGGGNTALSGLHGWMADIVVSFRLVISQGDVIEVSSSSKGDDLALFNALSGGGHGLGVITAITTSVFPISSLNMDGDTFWLRSLVFPATAIDLAVKTFMDVSQPPPAAINTLTYARGPPGTPMAGTPIIIVGSSFFGPVEEAERDMSVLLQEEVVASAVNATTEMMPISKLNDRFQPLETHGGHKTIASSRLKSINTATLKAAFERWVSATNEHPDAQRSPLIIGAVSTSKHEELGHPTLNAARFIEGRDRSIAAMMVIICKERDTMAAMAEFTNSLMAEFRNVDGAVARSFPNNLRFGIPLEEIFDEQRLVELRGLKKKWDTHGVFWSPFEV